MPTFVKRGKRLAGENFQNEMATLPERAMFVCTCCIYNFGIYYSFINW